MVLRNRIDVDQHLSCVTWQCTDISDECYLIERSREMIFNHKQIFNYNRCENIQLQSDIFARSHFFFVDRINISREHFIIILTFDYTAA